MPKRRRKERSERVTTPEPSNQEIVYRQYFNYSVPRPGADPFAQVSAFDYSIPVTTAPGTSIQTR